MTGPDAEAAVAAAFANFRATLADSQAHLARVAATPVHSPEERQQLDDDAAGGRLGPEMREIAERVRARETSWAEVFEGSSPYSELLLPHLTAMGERYADAWRAEIENDPDFEPLVEPGLGPDA